MTTQPIPGAPARDDWREQARHLIDQGLSNRAIARHPGMPGKDAIRHLRSQLAAAPHPSPATTPLGAPPAPHELATTATGVRHDAPPTGPGAPGGAPDPSHLTVDLDDGVAEDLAILAAAGLTAQDAVAYAVRLLADAHRTAWDYGDIPRGHRAQVRAHAIGAPTPDCAPQRTPHPTGAHT